MMMEAGQEIDADPDSQRALLNKKERRELRKINAAKEKAHKKFEALLSIGSGNDDGSERQTPTTKKRLRTKTAEPGLTKLKQTPPKKVERSKSEESLISFQDDPSVLSPPEKEEDKESKDKSGNVDSFAAVVDKARRKKKKPKPKPIESAAENDAFENPSDDEDAETKTPTYEDGNSPDEHSFHEDEVQDDDQTTQVEKRKKKRSKKKKDDGLADYVDKVLKKRQRDDGLLLCIVVHKADQVKPDARVRHPLIRVHLVNMESGEYIKKTDSARNVTSMFEKQNENENIDYILPLLTQPYDFKTNRTLTPHWEETLVYNEIYSYFLQREVDDPPVIIFFELLDFMQMNLKQKEFEKTDKGWYRIAWAFLKVLSPSGSTNTDRQVRLQFYQPLRRVRAPKDDVSLEVFRWWKYGSRIKYPSTLYITVKGVFPPEKLRATNRSMFPTQQERGAMSYQELNRTLDEIIVQSENEDQTPEMWTRLPGQVNKIPNKLHLRLPSGQKGCSVAQFSNNGRYLACACVFNDGYPILIYEFPEGKLISKFDNHFGIIYDLCWSANGKELLSGSADTTARCWDTKRFSSASIKQFAHPCFVYVCKYHTHAQNIVVTGGYDHVIRIWNKMSDNMQAIVLREVSEHKGFVNSIAFSNDGGRFFSADSVGVILEWACPTEKKKKVDLGEVVNRWQIVNTIQLPELKNTTLNTIHVHPGDSKLLVHSRDSMLRMVDLRSYNIAKTYVGGMNFKEYIHCALSTCGSYVFCGTEYGFVHVWSTETGNLIYTYKELEFTKSVSHVHFHPNDNYVVFCSYGDGHPIVVYFYDPKVNMEKEKEEMMNTVNTQRNFDNTEMLKSLQTTSLINDDDDERLAQVNEKLLSVTAQSTRNHVTFKESPQYAKDPNETFLSTWGSDFTYTTPMESPLGSPANKGVENKEHPKSSSTPQKPSSHDRSIQDTTMTMSQLETPSKDKPLKKREHGRSRKVKKVIAMYSYQSTETNQLTFSANDVITVVGKGNSEWGLGRLQDGHQGYFPRTYVMEYDEEQQKGALSSKSEGDVYSAVVDRHGDLKIISGNEDSDSAIELSRSHRKRKQRRDRMQRHQSDGNPTA